MQPLRCQVIYKNKFYEFNEGMQVYMFHLGILHGHDRKYGMKALLRYVELTCRCIDADSNTPRIEDFARYLSNHWKLVNDMDTYDILENFYEYIEE